MIVDGSGDKPYKGCLVIEGDKILFVGEKTDIKADRVVDVNGAMICPGLIDAHSHNDFFYDRQDAEKYYKPFIMQGWSFRRPSPRQLQTVQTKSHRQSLCQHGTVSRQRLCPGRHDRL